MDGNDDLGRDPTARTGRAGNDCPCTARRRRLPVRRGRKRHLYGRGGTDHSTGKRQRLPRRRNRRLQDFVNGGPGTTPACQPVRIQVFDPVTNPPRGSGSGWRRTKSSISNCSCATRRGLKNVSSLAGGMERSLVPVRGEGRAGRGATAVDHVRLFRLHPAHRWTYRVHEQILPALAPPVPTSAGRRCRGHVGYVDPAVRRRKARPRPAPLETGRGGAARRPVHAVQPGLGVAHKSSARTPAPPRVGTRCRAVRFGNRKAREFLLRREQEIAWERARTEERPASVDLHGRGIGHRRIQLVHARPSRKAWRGRSGQQAEGWRAFRSRVVGDSWPDVRLTLHRCFGQFEQ